jgi:hypothetical protein
VNKKEGAMLNGIALFCLKKISRILQKPIDKSRIAWYNIL